MPIKYNAEVTSYRANVKSVPIRIESGGENARIWNAHLWEKNERAVILSGAKKMHLDQRAMDSSSVRSCFENIGRAPPIFIPRGRANRT